MSDFDDLVAFFPPMQMVFLDFLDGSFDQAAFQRDQDKKARKREKNAAALRKKRARFGCLTKSGAQKFTHFEESEFELNGGGGTSGASSSSGGGSGNSGRFELLDNALLLEVLKFVPVQALRLGVAPACKRLHGPSMSSEAMSRTADMHLVCSGSKKTSAPTTAVLGALQRLNQDGGITRVVLVNSDFGKTTFKKLVKIVPLLTELELGWSKNVYKNGCSDINVEAAPHLEVYRHQNGASWHDQAPFVELLRGRSKMRILELSGAEFTDTILHELAANCPNLEVLVLRGWHSTLDKLTDGGVHALATGCLRLQKVVLSHKGWGKYAKDSGELTLHAVVQLLTLPCMAELSLVGFKFDDFSFKTTSLATRAVEAASAAEDVRTSILQSEAEIQPSAS